MERELGVLSLKDLQDEVVAWAESKGWYPDPNLGFGDMIALLHSEVSEALEAYRLLKLEPCTEGTGKPIDVASEFADILIRLLHYSAVLGFNLEAEFHRKMAYNAHRPWRHGGKAM